jgi:hypothetical protein
MDLHKVIVGALIYMFWSVLIGYLIVYLVSWAIIIAALVAGIYAGFKTKTSKGVINGLMAGLVGGITLGVVSIYMPTIYGVPLHVSIAGFLNPLVEMSSLIPWLNVPALAVIGVVFGTIGGLIGSISKLRKIFLFLTLFTLFMFYLALDNVAWWWGRATWDWSISLVLTHWVDITVSLGFSLFVVILAHVLKIYQ